MLQDEQVRKLFRLLSEGVSLRLASLKTGMDEKTARRYRREARMPSELWRVIPGGRVSGSTGGRGSRLWQSVFLGQPRSRKPRKKKAGGK